MKFHLSILLFLLICGTCFAATSSKPPMPRTEKTKTQATKIEDEKPVTIQKNEPSSLDGVQLQWFGHAFVYLTSQNGVRVALDPFSENTVIPFPKQLHADVVLISYEGLDRSGGERLYGTPQIFRGVTGIGVNRASGVLFRGIETYRDSVRGKDLGRNTLYIFELDGIKFCNPGGIGHTLDSRKIEDIGHADVLFLPVGNQALTPSEWRDIAEKLEAKWIVPIAYRDEKAGFGSLRPLEEFIEEFKLKTEGAQIKNITGNTFIIRASEIPEKPTLLLLKKP